MKRASGVLVVSVLVCTGGCLGHLSDDRSEAGDEDGASDQFAPDGSRVDSSDDTTAADATDTNADADASVADTGADVGTAVSDGAVDAASCAPGGPGLTNCGSGGDGGGTESCCTSYTVVGGTYYRTYTNSGGGATGEADPATVSTFRLDKYEVTVGRFRQFVNAWNGGNGWLPAAGSGKHTHLNGGLGLANAASPGTYESGWDSNDDANVAPTDGNLACAGPETTWTPSPGAHENLPISCVNWYEAYAFCIWDGGFLPSEAEWEYAAAGGGEQREYPWGSTDPGKANQYAIYNCWYPNQTGDCQLPAFNIAPVGTTVLGVARWGQLDVVGNVGEWGLDWYAQSDGAVAQYVTPCTDCSYLTGSSYRVDRGASYGDNGWLDPPQRWLGVANHHSDGQGVRCARTP